MSSELQAELDALPSRVLVEKYRAAMDDEDNDLWFLIPVHHRGGQEEFDIGVEYCRSPDPKDRAVGTNVLAQLGGANPTFREESISVLLPMLDDPDNFVVYCAAVALGHRCAESAIDPLVRLSYHSDPRIRFGAVIGLMCHQDQRVIRVLIERISDSDFDTRNWATCGLGSFIRADSPDIRAALRLALKDSDSEVRGEALFGLALRKDPSVVDEILHEWQNDEVSMLSLEAAEEIADPRLLERMEHLTAVIDPETQEVRFRQLQSAKEACKSKAE